MELLESPVIQQGGQFLRGVVLHIEQPLGGSSFVDGSRFAAAGLIIK